MSPTLMGILALGMLVSFLVLRPGANPARFGEFMERGATIVDVRSSTEFAGGAIRGALNIPVGDLSARIGEIPEGPVVVYCASGMRSRRARAVLEGHGRDVLDMARIARFPDDYRSER